MYIYDSVWFNIKKTVIFFYILCSFWSIYKLAIFFSFYSIVVRGNSEHGENGSLHQIYLLLLAYPHGFDSDLSYFLFRTVFTHVNISQRKLRQSQKWSTLPLNTVCSFKKISTICIYVNMNVCLCVLVYMYVCVSVCM